MKDAFERLVPRIADEYKLLFEPKKYGTYVNDHCIIRAEDGKWHLIGITAFESDPVQERYFVHAVSDTIAPEAGMIELNKVVDEGHKAWAPCVVPHNDKYYMLYGPSPTKLAVSIDLSEWWPFPVVMQGEPVYGAHRDHMIVKLNDYTWLMYMSGVKDRYSAISCFVSNDLVHWRFVQYALTSSGNAPLNPSWGAFESPYVVKRGDYFYLFTTYTDGHVENYHNTLVFVSTNPYDFGDYTGDNHGDMVIAEMKAHAGEVLYDPEADAWYITSAGWRGKGVPFEGGVAIAKLEWDKR